MLLIICLLVFSGSLKALPWYFEQNRVQDSWNLGIRGDGVEIDLVDSYFVMVDSLKGKVQYFEPLDLGSEKLSDVEMMHGTAMVGLIVADQQMLDDVLNPGEKLTIAGIAPGARIRVHPFFNKKFVDSMSNAYQTISRQRNARGKPLTPEDIDPTRIAVISVSSGTRSVDGDLTLLLREIQNKNILVVAAVGNDGKEIRQESADKIYPAARRRPNLPEDDPIIRVAALSKYRNVSLAELYKNSNYGVNFTDIASPGVTPTLTLENKARINVGTSNAAAVTSGALALLISCNPYATSSKLRSTILSTAYKSSTLKDKVLDGNILRINDAIDKFCFDEAIESEELVEYSKILITIVIAPIVWWYVRMIRHVRLG